MKWSEGSPDPVTRTFPQNPHLPTLPAVTIPFTRVRAIAACCHRAQSLGTRASTRTERGRTQRLATLVGRRAAGEPLQYLEETVDFGPLTLKIDRRALIPRPETERVWEEAVSSLREAGSGTVIVDLGTGSGVLALGLKHSFPAARVIGVDVSADALSLARENGEATGLEVEWIEGDLFDALPRTLEGRIDLIVSNPLMSPRVTTCRPRSSITNHTSPSTPDRSAPRCWRASPTRGSGGSEPEAGSSAKSATARRNALKHSSQPSTAR